MPKKYPYQNLSLKDMKGEEWEDIPGLDGYFRISNFGRIKRMYRRFVNSRGRHMTLIEKIIAPRVMRTPNTYVKDFTFQLSAHMQVEGKKFYIPVRRLVYYCFVKPFDLKDKSIIIVSKKGNGLGISPENLLVLHYSDLTRRIIQQKRVIPEFRTPDYQLKGVLASLKITCKQISQYNATGKKIKTYPSSMEASRQTGISNSHISNTAKGIDPTAGGYFWAFGNARRFDVETFLGKRRIGFKEKKGTKVTQYNFKGERIARYLTLTDAADAVGAKSYISISSVIKGKARSALGYFWKKGWGKKKIDLNGYIYGHASSGFNRSIKVKQYSLSGKYLRTFSSVTEASEKVGVDMTAISYALRFEERTAAGFKWKHAKKGQQK